MNCSIVTKANYAKLWRQIIIQPADYILDTSGTRNIVRKHFECPHCSTHSSQTLIRFPAEAGANDEYGTTWTAYFGFKCDKCEEIHIYTASINAESDRDLYNPYIIYPHDTIPKDIPSVCEGLPEDIKNDYDEAALIVEISPRGAAALLRLCIQKLCHNHFGGKIKIDKAVKELNIGTSNKDFIKALDIVRVIGNEAVHPGQLDLRDDPDTAKGLFALVNYISGNMMQSSKIKKKYGSLPPEILKWINDRDKNSDL